MTASLNHRSTAARRSPTPPLHAWVLGAMMLLTASLAVASPRPAADTFGPNDGTLTDVFPLIIVNSPGQIFSGVDAAFIASSGGILQSASVSLTTYSSGPPPTSLILSVSADQSGVPGDELEAISLSVPPLSVSPTLLTFASTSQPLLVQGQKYWLSLRVPSTLQGIAEWRRGVVQGTSRLCASTISGNCADVSGLAAALRVIVDDPVVPSSGACCARDGTCLVLPPATCTSFAGQYLGDTTTCSPNFCFTALPTGACCRGATCTVQPSFACRLFGISGVYLGNGSTCNPPTRTGRINVCCAADFNGSGGASVQDLFDFLTEFFAACP